MNHWPELPPAPLLGWIEIADAAVQAADQHMSKTVQACKEESELRGDGPFRAAASRAVQA